MRVLLPPGADTIARALLALTLADAHPTVSSDEKRACVYNDRDYAGDNYAQTTVKRRRF